MERAKSFNDGKKENALTHAIRYLEQGYSVIPVKGRFYSEGSVLDERLKESKAPLVKWTEYQRRHPTMKELAEWFAKWRLANIAIVTGKISNIVVVDLDSQEALLWAKELGIMNTLIVRTSRGAHAYYKYPAKGSVRNSVDIDMKVDIRSDGGYVIAPPSVHLSGSEYVWDKSVSHLAELPDIFLSKKSRVVDLKPLYGGVGKGKRNDSLARLCGSWVNDGLSYEECLDMAKTWNVRNNPPMVDKEMTRTIRSIFYRHSLNDAAVQKMYHEKNLLRFPLFTHSKIRIHKVEEISVINEYGKESRKWVVMPSRMGLPGPFDEAVFMAVNRLLSDMPKPISNPVDIGGLRDMARTMNLNHNSGKITKMIKESLVRLKSITIITEKTFYDADKKMFITDTFGLFDRIIFSGQIDDNGERVFGTRIWLNIVFLKNVNAGFSSSLDYGIYISLDNVIARGIYRCLSPILAISENIKINISYKKLVQRLQIKEEKNLSKIKQQLSEAHKELGRKVFSKIAFNEFRSGKVIISYFR